MLTKICTYVTMHTEVIGLVIECTPTIELYKDPVSGFKVVACKPREDVEYPGLQLNKYKNISLTGSNLSVLKIGILSSIVIEPNPNGKYAGSYIFKGFSGVLYENGQITIDKNQELTILRNIMTEQQACNIHKAYPDFVQLILNNQKDQIDYKKIRNVGAKRLNEYAEKIQDNLHYIAFVKKLSELGINNPDYVQKISQHYKNVDEFEKEYKYDPWEVLSNALNLSFKKIDKFILQKNPELITSDIRCKNATKDGLKKIEYVGDTRIEYDLLKEYVNSIAPECINNFNNILTQYSDFYNNKEYVSWTPVVEAESNIAHTILAKLKSRKPDMDWHNYVSVDGLNITEEQSKILELACTKNVMILTGGAGTGKSTSMNALVHMLENYGRSYTLLAPTGIAAKKLQDSTNREASTIHRFLAMNQSPGGSIAGNISEFFIIDECSMIGVKLMSSLCHFINQRKDSKIIFVCDESQLSSIECGNLVQDLLDSNLIPRANLTKVFRYGIGGIATIATDARNGIFEPYKSTYNDFLYIKEQNAIEQIVQEYKKLLTKYDYNDIIVLSPFNKGDYGTYILNENIQQLFPKHKDTGLSYKIGDKEKYDIHFYIGDKVINTHNNYYASMAQWDEESEMWIEKKDEENITIYTSIMNGDIGNVVGYNNSDNDVALVADFNGELVYFNKTEIHNLLIGYAISIHKIQGAQAKAVLILIDPSHKNLLSRNLVYVAVSRAQEYMELIGDENSIANCLQYQENKNRNTWLKEFLLKGANIKNEICN